MEVSIDTASILYTINYAFILPVLASRQNQIACSATIHKLREVLPQRSDRRLESCG